MSKVLQNIKATISLGTVELFCLFVLCCYTSMEATVLSRWFSWVWSNMHKSPWSNKSPISLERVMWFCWFFESSYLGWNCQVYNLSANQIVRCFKLKKLKKNMRYQVDFLLPLKLEEILCYFGWWPQNTLGQSVCRIFDFWLVWLVKLNTTGPLLQCTCYIFSRLVLIFRSVSLLLKLS